MFMEPETYQGHFQRINNTPEGDLLSPEAYTQYPCNSDAAKAYNVGPDDVETVFGWFARLSASGYLYATEWCGPFDSEQEAIEYIKDLHDSED